MLGSESIEHDFKMEPKVSTEVWFRGDKISPIDIAWAAGIFEGEGCFTSVTSESGKKYIGLQVNMTDKDVIERLYNVFNKAGTFAPWHPPAHRKTGRKQQYRWRVSGKKAQEIFWLLAPQLASHRRARFVEMSIEISNHNSELAG